MLKKVVGIIASSAIVAGIANIGFAGIEYASYGKIDVWDFGCVQAIDSSLYQNHIPEGFWSEFDGVYGEGISGQTKGWFSENGGEATFGDLTLTYMRTDRLYAESIPEKTYGTQSVQNTVFSDGYTAGGYYYCNGAGKENQRYITIENVRVGDTVSVYLYSQNTDTDNINFKCLTDESVATQTLTYGRAPERRDFYAEKDGTYKIFVSGLSATKPGFFRVTRTPAARVTGTIDFSVISKQPDSFELNFKNINTDYEFNAKVDGNNFSVYLPPMFRYMVKIKATDIGVSNDGKFIDIEKNEGIIGKEGIIIKAVDNIMYRYMGNIKGLDPSFSGEITGTAKPSDKSFEEIPLSIRKYRGTITFNALLEPNVTYNIELLGVNDYYVKSGGDINNYETTRRDITLEKKTLYSVSGSFFGYEDPINLSNLIFTNVEDGYKYTGEVINSDSPRYEVKLRDGAYSVNVSSNSGYITSTHVVVNKRSVNKDIFMLSKRQTITPLKHTADIYVGDPIKDNNFKTIKEAVAAAKAMNPSDESQRITINIAPGLYREQIQIDTPYITFKNSAPEKGNVTITWYYGIGYKYYSIKDGFYSEESAYDKYEKGSAARWGATVYVKSPATAFRAENIIFEASFNRYITDEELADGVEPDLKENIRFRRVKDADVKSKEATERASAMVYEADQTEFYNCVFYGSQDTLCAGNNPVFKSYLKDCFIEGNTDYIFGQGNVVFDNCTLSLYGYTKGSTGGYITAAKEGEQGYLFYNCTIQPNPDMEMIVTPTYLGRPWDANGTVFFYNTKVTEKDIINPEGWTSMSGNDPVNARFGEYNTIYADGVKVDISKRIVKAKNEDPKLKINDILGDWVPSYFE
ncbi:MAG: hypothetical protein LBR74_00880 [Eubacterium sp.]|jgi:pectin methylesterase-like acyl-CoA thioesterase|nr:hypothetical protein [Eubacterium sp.]